MAKSKEKAYVQYVFIKPKSKFTKLCLRISVETLNAIEEAISKTSQNKTEWINEAIKEKLKNEII